MPTLALLRVSVLVVVLLLAEPGPPAGPEALAEAEGTADPGDPGGTAPAVTVT